MNEQQMIQSALKGNQDAIGFCNIILQASQVIDDLIDQDKPVDARDIEAVFWNMLVALPCNAFYIDNLKQLTPLLQHALSDWFDANTLEKMGDGEQNIAFVLRDTISSLVIDCAYIVGGYAWGRKVSAEIRLHYHDESLTDYKTALQEVQT